MEREDRRALRTFQLTFLIKLEGSSKSIIDAVDLTSKSHSKKSSHKISRMTFYEVPFKLRNFMAFTRQILRIYQRMKRSRVHKISRSRDRFILPKISINLLLRIFPEVNLYQKIFKNLTFIL